MSGSRQAALTGGAGVVPKTMAPDASSSDSDLTYATIPRPARHAAGATLPPARPRLPVATKRVDGNSASKAAEVSIEALVTADRSLSSTFSKERVESWRANVEASEDSLDLSYDRETNLRTPRPPGMRVPGSAESADEADPAFSEGTPKARPIRSQDSSDGRKELRAPRQLQASHEATAHAGRRSRQDGVQNERGEGDTSSGLPSSPGRRAQRMRFGRDRTNESIDRESADGSASSAVSDTDSTSRERKGKPQKRIRLPKKSRQSQQKHESDGDAEERKQRARAKWAAIDSYPMETVYTL